MPGLASRGVHEPKREPVSSTRGLAVGGGARAAEEVVETAARLLHRWVGQNLLIVTCLRVYSSVPLTRELEATMALDTATAELG